MMNQTTTAKYNIDDIDDLTRFADESFDTDEVDLFQFSGDESSPITSLKSVILSLDWDITDDYLQDLADELANLAPDWQDNKIASIYLQGMGKIGKYLRLRGAHAHPNSIKLLLTFFHHFETIVSSSDISDERTATLVQSDVRKFKVLQYQIKLAEEAADREDEQASPGMGLSVSRDIGEAGDALRNFKAAILELDWEVSDDSLARFATVLQALSQEKIQNRAAHILIQGLQALGQYIADERAKAHPEVFNLLHAFHDGLEKVLDEGPNAPDQRQKNSILVDRVNRLNHLKTLIAAKDTVIPEPVPIPKTGSSPKPEETLVDKTETDLHSHAPALDMQQTESVAPVADGLEVASVPEEQDGPVSDASSPVPEEDLLLIEDDVSPATDFLPSGDTEDTKQAGLAEDFPIELDMEKNLPTENGIESEIDELFAASSKRAMLSAEEEYPIEELPAHAYHAVDDELADGFIEDNIGTRNGITPALADISEDAGFHEDDEMLDPETKTDLDEQLNFFFGESGDGVEQSEPAASLFDEVFEQANDDDADSAELSAEEDIFALLEKDPAATPANVAGAEKEELFILTEEKTGASIPLGDDDEIEAVLPATDTAPADEDALPAALADAEYPEDDPLPILEADEEITSKLDSFFDAVYPEEVPALEDSFDETETKHIVQQDAEKTLVDELDSLFDVTTPGPTSQLDPSDADRVETVATHSADATEEDIDDALVEDAIADDVVAALSDVEEPVDEQGAVQEDDTATAETDPDLQLELDNFFDLPNQDLEPTTVELVQLAVEPEDAEEDGDDEDMELSVFSGPALADVPVPSRSTVQSEETSPEIEQLLSSFLEDKPEPNATFDAHANVSTDNNSLLFSEQMSVEQPHEPADALFVEPVAMDTNESDLEHSQDIEDVLLEDQLFHPEKTIANRQDEIESSPGSPQHDIDISDDISVLQEEDAMDQQDLQLETGTVTQPSPTDQFEDILDTSEVQAFLLSGQDIEDIPDEELEFTDEDTDASAEVELFSSAPSLADQETAVESVADTASLIVQDSETYTDFTRLDVEETFAPAIVEPADLITDDDLLANKEGAVTATTAVHHAAIPEASDAAESDEEPTLHDHDDSTLDAAIAALGAALPNLLNNFSTEQLSTTRQELHTLHASALLSPAQKAAANMLETVLAELPRYTGGSESSAAAVDSLYQALAQPQEHLPVKAVSAFTNWVQTLLSEISFADTDVATAKKFFTARDIYQELSGFRAHVEEELAQLRQEIRNK